MKRVSKALTLALAAVVLLALLGWLGFHAKEHVAGNGYVGYLEANMATAPLGESPDFALMDDDLAAHSLVLVGEIHGFEAPLQFDVDLFSHLLTEYGVTDYLVELDPSQAYFLNRYNETGDDSLLTRALENWVVMPGRDNRDYRDKWVALREVYQGGPSFRYLGTNNLSDLPLLFDHLNELGDGEQIEHDAARTDSLNLIAARLEVTSRLDALPAADSLRRADYAYLLSTIDAALDDRYREEVLTENVLALYERFGLKDEKVYGYYGLGHTLLAPLEGGYTAMAARLSEADPWFEDRILSANFLFVDSYMTQRSSTLPSLLRDDGFYTRLPTSHDNLLLSYVHGIKDLKRVTEPRTTTVFKLDGADSPYRTSNRLFQTTKLLPVGQLMNGQEGLDAVDYGQYVVLVRDSDWAEPLHPAN
jgi:hypothetical protein